MFSGSHGCPHGGWRLGHSSCSRGSSLAQMGAHRHSASSDRCSETQCTGSLGSLRELTLWSVRFAVSCWPCMQAACAGLRVSGTRSSCSAFSRSRSHHVGNHNGGNDGVWVTVPNHLRGPALPPQGWPQAVESTLGDSPPPCAGSRQRAASNVREELESGCNCHLPTSSLPPGLALPGLLGGELSPEQLPTVSLKEVQPGQLGTGLSALGRQGAGSRLLFPPHSFLKVPRAQELVTGPVLWGALGRDGSGPDAHMRATELAPVQPVATVRLDPALRPLGGRQGLPVTSREAGSVPTCGRKDTSVGLTPQHVADTDSCQQA